jgi:hypothetical protein
MTQEERVQYKFMIPASLKQRIEDAAHENRRSVSAEIVGTLEEAYPAPTGDKLDEAHALISSVIAKLLESSEEDPKSYAALLETRGFLSELNDRYHEADGEQERIEAVAAYEKVVEAIQRGIKWPDKTGPVSD